MDKNGKNNQILGITIIIILVLCVNFFINNNSKNTEQNAPTTSKILQAKPLLIQNIKFILNPDCKIINEQKIYYTKSTDYENVYFIGTLIKHSNKIDTCIWICNDPNMNGMVMSANDNAVLVSPLPDARKSDAQTNESDDGYARINQQLSNDCKKLTK